MGIDSLSYNAWEKHLVNRNLVLIALLLVFCDLVLAQGETRAGLWQAERDKKRENLRPYASNIAEETMLRLEKGAGFNIKSFYPVIGGSTTSGAGFSAGVRYWKHRVFGTRSDFQALALHSIKGYQLYQVQYGQILQKGPEPFLGFGGTGGLSEFRGTQKRRGDLFLYTDFLYVNFPQEDYYGLGPDSPEEDRTDYLLETAAVDGVLGYKWNRHAVTAVRSGYIHTNVRSGRDDRFPGTEELFDDTTAPGLSSQPDFFRTSALAFLDYRDNPGHPHRGGLYGFQYSRFEDLDEEQFNFHRYLVDLRQYVPLGSPQRVLAARFLTIFNQADEGDRIPFYFLHYLGGSRSLRGYDRSRFRDNNLLYLSAEYRWEGVHALEFALFADAGKVFPEISDFGFDELKATYGVGVRLKTAATGFFRFDIGRSPEGIGYYLHFGSGF